MGRGFGNARQAQRDFGSARRAQRGFGNARPAQRGFGNARPAQRGTEAGVTLVEMLVVLSVIAVAAGVVMLRFPAGTGSTVATEAGALALTLTRASDQALSTGRARSLEWSADGYHVLAWVPGTGWTEEPGLQRRLAASATLARSDGGTKAPVLLGTDALSAPATFRLGTGAAAWRVAFDGLTARALPLAAADPALAAPP